MARPAEPGRRVRFYDRLGAHLIAVGGVGVVVAVLGIFAFIVRETVPLFRSARHPREAGVAVARADQVRAIGVDPYREVVYTLGPGGVTFVDRATSRVVAVPPIEAIGATAVSAACRSPGDGRIALGLSDGRVVTATVGFDVAYEDQGRRVAPRLEVAERVRLLDDAVRRVAYRYDGERRWVLAAVDAEGHLAVRVAERARSLLGAGRVHAVTFALGDAVGAPITALAIDDAVRHLVAGTAAGDLYVWQLGGVDEAPAGPRVVDATPRSGAPITVLAFLLGGQSLVVGDGDGDVSTWFEVPGAHGTPRRQQIHRIKPHAAAVTAVAVSQRDKQFLTGDAKGHVALHHATSEQTFFTETVGHGAVRDLVFAPKADGFLALVAGADSLAAYGLDNPHPEISLGTLFGRVWYEGYERPEYVWQSTGGTDEFEPKFSLVPLIFGTVKGTVYALLFALPMGVLAALYTAQFASSRVRAVVKPTVEIMATLPSVILGFLAGLWLAPLLEDYIVGTALLLLATPLVMILAAGGWQHLPRGVRRHLPHDAEFIVLAALTLGSAAAAIHFGPTLEEALFGTSLPRWLSAETGLRYDQRNSLVIGFAMGFAVIPLIFTICEDALSGVPASLKAASLGLGATRWQTAVRVVLPMALPGVFSAAMIGFGRAVGETMIVLMATGNTPIMEWNVFSGMRTISANIAVELPEAPHAGTLYRVLFLSGLLLFVVTFAVNTVAEGVRQRLRDRYQRV